MESKIMKYFKLLCHTDLICDDDTMPCVTKGKLYEAMFDDFGDIYIVNDEGDMHYFDTNPEDKAYYGNWFSIVSEFTMYKGVLR